MSQSCHSGTCARQRRPASIDNRRVGSAGFSGRASASSKDRGAGVPAWLDPLEWAPARPADRRSLRAPSYCCLAGWDRIGCRDADGHVDCDPRRANRMHARHDRWPEQVHRQGAILLAKPREPVQALRPEVHEARRQRSLPPHDVASGLAARSSIWTNENWSSRIGRAIGEQGNLGCENQLRRRQQSQAPSGVHRPPWVKETRFAQPSVLRPWTLMPQFAQNTHVGDVKAG